MLRAELNLSEEVFDAATAKKYESLLEKKWTSIVRLQRKVRCSAQKRYRLATVSAAERPHAFGTKKALPPPQILDLEASNRALQSEVDNATPDALSRRQQDPASWLPSAPARHTLESHRAPINCVAFHPVFMSLASGSDDYTIKIWDWELGDLERTVKGHTRAVLDVDFGGGGGRHHGPLLASCSSDMTVKLWDPADEYKNIRTLAGHEHSVSAVRFIPSSSSASGGSLLGT